MKLSCIYWTLLLISVISSCLLFMIVASEGTHGPLQKHQIDKNKLRDNVTVNEVPGDSRSGILGTLSILREKSHVKTIDKTDTIEETPEEKNGAQKILETLQETLGKGENSKENVDLLNESLTQQPNLSQGISETGQSVVLTLVNTASAELHNLAEPHLSSEAQSKPPTKNLTVPPSSAQETEKTISFPSPGVVPPPSISTLLSTDELNATDSKTGESPPDPPLHELDPVLVVRADQRPLEDLISNSEEPSLDHEVPKDEEDPGNPEEQLPASGELDDGAARVKFGSGSPEEATADILDGIVGSGSSEHHEDIPSFSEWTQKRLQEAEKKKTHPNASIQNTGNPSRSVSNMKVRSKNYASPDCGAKIVAVNPEARSARSVLVSTRDEYMLNTCTSRVWFVVELCEAIQAKKIELANFELFSSSPKEFSVFVSDRFPTRDWSAVGQFTARDERDIQSFALHPHLFGKFIKIELHSHYGSEHFCPISLFRAYGTSEFEVLETETEIQETSDNEDDDDDEEVSDNDTDSSRNLFGSATDAVIRIVKKAAEVLVKTGDPARDNITNQASISDNKSLFDNCMTPRYTILCHNCTDDKFTRVYQLLSCRIHHLDPILKIPFVTHTLHDDLCNSHGIEITESSKKEMSNKNPSSRNIQGSAFISVFSPDYVIALCNLLAIEAQNSLINPSPKDHGTMSNTTSVNTESSKAGKESIILPQITPTCLQDSDGINCRSIPTVTSHRTPDSSIKEESNKDTKPTSTLDITATPEILASQIKPTKTLSKEDLKRESSVPILEPSKDVTEETVQAEVVTTPSPLVNSATSTFKVMEEPPIVTPLDITTQTTYMQTVNSVQENTSAENNVPKTDGEVQKSEASQVKLEDKEEKLKEPDDMRLTPQDQLSFDNLLSDLKDFESDPSIAGSASNPSTITYPTASSTPQQKESVFLRLSNRIKALERNMSLSGQYLEELSRRYKRQVEEMQRSLERATAAMSEEFRRGEEREFKRSEEITALREEVTSLSDSLEILLYDHNSWSSKLSTFGQHIIFIFVELVVLVVIISYCRKSMDLDNDFPTKVSVKEVTRRKSAESMISSSTSKKRRPSEIASKITGTYRELMIDDRPESRKERKKKRKGNSLMRLTTSFDSRRENLKTILPSRRSSSMDCCNYNRIEQLQTRRRPGSAPDSYELNMDQGKDDDEGRINGVPQNRIVVEEIDGLNRSNYIMDGFIQQLSNESRDCGDQDNLRSTSPRGISILKNRLNSPSFIKTALKSRSQRGDKHNYESNSPFLRSDNWEWYSRSSGGSRSDQDSPRCDSRNGNSLNGHHGVSDDSGSGSNTPTPSKKKKEGSFKKIVKKFF